MCTDHLHTINWWLHSFVFGTRSACSLRLTLAVGHLHTVRAGPLANWGSLFPPQLPQLHVGLAQAFSVTVSIFYCIMLGYAANNE
jgi:hypothetical protein